MADAPPPQPPPHGSNPRPPGAMPDGNYDIFIIPPHSSGGGFLYLPSLQPHRNSFLAGVACALLAVGVYAVVVPVLKQWFSAIMAGGGGIGVLFLIVGIGVAGWALGKTQGENNPSNARAGSGNGKDNSAGSGSQSNGYAPPPNNGHAPPPPPPRPDSRAPPPKNASTGWEKAREETRRREEERKQTEELKKKREEAQKAKEEAERAAKAKAEKEKWEQARAREKDQREREARERIAKERAAREAERAKPTASARTSPSKPSSRYEKPTARSYAGTEDEPHSFRPYDKDPKRPHYKSSASSIISGLSEGSYAPSNGTSRTSPPPSQRGPYSTSDPDKIQIKAVYLFSDSFPLKPVASLVAGTPPVTDGLVLRITTEGLFIDDDVRRVPQREWDVKAWTLKLVEDGLFRGATMGGTASLHVVRATARDVENKKYTFVLDEAEAWKVAIGLQRLRKGSQVRALGMNGMKDAEVKNLLASLGFI